MNKVSRQHIKLIFFTLALLFVGGAAVAQGDDKQFVIKQRNADHYLAHIYNETEHRWEVQDTIAFSPSCLWYSGRNFNIAGTNHNYYFYDAATNKYHFLSASFVPNAQLTLSEDTPETYMLNNSDTLYYFYEWDWDHWTDDEVKIDGAGLARGHQYTEVNTSEDCHYNWESGQCWEAYWAELKEVTGIPGTYKWEMSGDYHYYISNDCGRFRLVTTTPHEWEITSTGGGLGNNVAVLDGENQQNTALNYGDTRSLSVPIADFTYRPRYTTYEFDEVTQDHTQYQPIPSEHITHYQFNYHGNTSGIPSEVEYDVDATGAVSYEWTLSGPGRTYLSFNDATSATPTLTYSSVNNQGHKTATVTVTVTYSNGYTQSSSVDVLVKTSCQNPQKAAEPVITYDDVTVSWYPTAESYKVYWKRHELEWGSASSATVNNGNTTSYTIIGLENSVTYDYKVVGICSGSEVPDAYEYTFTMKDAPDALICGAVFGGGRMADVSGKTEIIVVNCDSIGAVYGGNDIAGTVYGNSGADGSSITLGVTTGTTVTSAAIRIGAVYGGGNGYYTYDGDEPGPTIGTTCHIDRQFNTSVTEVGGSESYMTSGTIPTITKTAITVNSNYIKVDSIFGGAKNAFLTATTGNGSDIDVKGGTIYALFGGNNYGGTQGAAKQYVLVEGTTVKTSVSEYNSNRIGRDFGIGYVFGGGNKVTASTTEVIIQGGQCDTVFAGGNSASVATAATVEINCTIDEAASGVVFGNIYSNAISSYIGETFTIKPLNSPNPLDNYQWDGTGIYNIRALFGGNNRAAMNVLPTVSLTSGSVSTVYGGGNAGDMLAHIDDNGTIATDFGSPTLNNVAQTIQYSTHLLMNSATMFVDNLYGGCQMSNVDYSTWVELQNGHVGNVFGGCNISGDVGSNWRIAYSNGMSGEEYQYVKGATYVKASGGTVYRNLFAGSNGYYHCNDGVNYIDGIINEGHYIGMSIPTHNETHVMVSGTTTKVNGNVYAGGNMAPVGFINETALGYTYRTFVGFASVRMTGGTVEGDVYGGGNMASVYGSNEVRVSGGTIGGALYGGNDQCGLVAQISNRVMSPENAVASNSNINLTALGVHTYVRITGKPKINTVYGGGNGAYDYTPANYCNPNDQPVQSNTFVDINIDGSDANPATRARINTVYGGGNGVTVTGGITVLVNVSGASIEDYPHVGTIFGGNNMGDLSILPDFILMSGRVDTIYGGCNAGAMLGSYTVDGYNNVGSRVILRDTYTPLTLSGTTPTPLPLNGVVSGAIFGGCRMNNVTNNTLVLVEAGNHGRASLFGGCDISGEVGSSQVVVTGGYVGNVYGGGNGYYTYAEGGNVYTIETTPHLVATGVTTAPICGNSQVDILGGQVGDTGEGNSRDIFGGGYGHLTSTTGNVLVNVDKIGSNATDIFGNVYGGSALGSVNTLNNNTTTTVNILEGTIHGDVFGGGLGQKVGYYGTSNIEATVNGKVYVNIGAGDFTDPDHPVYSGNATLLGNVYGCNNYNGSPKDEVYVNIYKTAHGVDAEHNLYPTEPSGGWNVTTLADNAALPQAYAINAVFGGGNLASYKPEEEGKKATVHVYACDNTIKDIFGGGNAADVGVGVSGGSITTRTDTYVIIEGGRIHRVIGGGNGEDPDEPAANIFGTANTTVYAGLIDEVYGGANQKGDVDAINLTMSNHNNSSLSNCSDEVYGSVFGCANAADYNRSVTTNILCGVGEIGELYGGSNLADIGRSGSLAADVTLNLYGGVHTQVFAGSKGSLANPSAIPLDPGKASNIYGNVTLNLFGGTVTNAYGGSNYNGNIAGTITVNVLDEEGSCPLDVTNIYGASNLAKYEPDDGATISPVINVIHIGIIDDNPATTEINEGTLGIRGNVYGGGNQASVKASPQVNIGYDETTMASILTNTGYVQPATGFSRAYVTGNVFGGGNEAGVTGNPEINLRNGTVHTDIYGGCNTNGTVTGDIAVNLTGGTVDQDVFGGGMGNATETAGDVVVTVDGATVTRNVYGGSALGQVNSAITDLTKVWINSGSVIGNVYGGGMGQTGHGTYGKVNGHVEVLINGGTVGVDAEHLANVYGGGLGQDTKVKGDVAVTVNGASATIWGDVYGGSAKGKVNTDNGTSQSGTSKTDVTLTAGIVHGNLYGGGHGPDGDEAADVFGPIIVTVEGGTVTNVFGCNNNSGTPKNTVRVNVDDGTVTNVYGGGHKAAYIPLAASTDSPKVYITNGVVTNNVVGGCKSANIGDADHHANPEINISGGKICAATSGEMGIYGGCYTTGTVNGDISITITSNDAPSADTTVIGTKAALNDAYANDYIPVSVHGGGYGAGTATTGNVTVVFGSGGELGSDSNYPRLYGDLYGGSALGTVNNDADDLTTVTVINGSVKYVEHTVNTVVIQTGGNIFGGGRGLDGIGNESMGQVNGVVHVNIGTGTLDSHGYATNVTGKAYLKGCNVFGCNNTNGSPQENVYVDVYQTHHETIDLVTATGYEMDKFAIRNVYGGGNKSKYYPNSNLEDKRVHNTIHGCENTIQNVYGGGNAADTYGTVVAVDGGRFKYIFGGGNGQSIPANILDGGVNIAIYGGHVGWAFSGCNLHGTIGSNNPIEQYGCTSSYCPCSDVLEIENYYFGANEAVTVDGLSHVINCGDDMEFTNVYGGSRLAVVYGNIQLWVRGGTITNLFAGNEGSDEVQADVRKYPASDYNWTTNPDRHPNEVKNYLIANSPDPSQNNPNASPLCGTGGNIILVLEGGHLGNVYGGNDYRGNVEGDITIIIDSTQRHPCELSIDYLYAGNRLSGYTPDSTLVNGLNEVTLNPNRISPIVYFKNGSVNYDVYGGSMGGDPTHHFGNGYVVSNPKLVIGDPATSTTHKVHVGRDIFGGGSDANTWGNPNVILQGNVTVGGSVYGGGKHGNVDGGTNVSIAPTTTIVQPVTPEPPTRHLTVEIVEAGYGSVSVIYYHNSEPVNVSGGGDVPEGAILEIQATPAEGHSFVEWQTDYGNIQHPTHTSTTCTMGPRATTLRAIFN